MLIIQNLIFITQLVAISLSSYAPIIHFSYYTHPINHHTDPTDSQSQCLAKQILDKKDKFFSLIHLPKMQRLLLLAIYQEPYLHTFKLHQVLRQSSYSQSILCQFHHQFLLSLIKHQQISIHCEVQSNINVLSL